jgi:hypothetical protein
MVTRRVFLSQALAAGGALSMGYGPGRATWAASPVAECPCDDNALGIHAVAGSGDDLVALVGDGAEWQLADLVRAGNGGISLGRSRSIASAFPSGFFPTTLDIGPLGLLVGGAELHDAGTVVIDNRQDHLPEEIRSQLPADGRPNGFYEETLVKIRPALFSIEADDARPLPLPDLPAWSFADVSAVASRSDGSLVVAVDHSEDDAVCIASAVHLAERSTSGSWSNRHVVGGLGEGGPTLLAESRDGLGVVTNGPGGRWQVHQQRGRGFVESRPGDGVEGRARAAGSRTAAIGVVQTTRGGSFRVTEKPAGSTEWRQVSGSVDRNVTTDVVPVNGFAREFVLISGTTARIIDAGGA